MRKLNDDCYFSYAIEDTSQARAFLSLAQFAQKNPNCMIEAVSPGYYSDGDEAFYTLTFTASGIAEPL